MYESVEPEILHIEACNYVNNPVGGQLNFSRQLMEVFGNRLALAGWATSSDEPVGRWFDKVIDGTVYKYFAFGREISSERKPLIPARLITLIQYKRHQKRILSLGIANIILREHVLIMGINAKAKHNICYCFPGIESPLSISRYHFGKLLSDYFDHFLLKAVYNKANCILAAADERAITELRDRSKGKLGNKKIVSFPTRVDTGIFHPYNCIKARREKGLSIDATIVVTVGRIHWAKGWKFLVDSFKFFRNLVPNSMLVFIGDGSERKELQNYTKELGMTKSILLAGVQSSCSIAAYLQAADLFVMGSMKEGWSTVLVEALACHVPIVTTCFSSADTIVQHGVNGFVVERDALAFAQAMLKAINLPKASGYYDTAIKQYALSNFERDLFRVWPFI